MCTLTTNYNSLRTMMVEGLIFGHQRDATDEMMREAVQQQQQKQEQSAVRCSWRETHVLSRLHSSIHTRASRGRRCRCLFRQTTSCRSTSVMSRPRPRQVTCSSVTWWLLTSLIYRIASSLSDQQTGLRLRSFASV